MNHIVPDFESNEDYRIPELHTKSSMGGGNEDTMELLWQNGQLVMHSQNQSSSRNKRPLSRPQLEFAAATTVIREVRSSVDKESGPSDLFMQEDEMASWLHYPMDENSIESYLFNNDLLYPIPPSSAPITTASVTLPLPLPPPPSPSVLIPSSRPSIPPFRRVEMESGPPKYTNFMHFSRSVKSFSPELGQSCSSKMAPAKILPSPSTVVASNETQAPESKASRVSDKPTPMNIGGGGSMSGVGVARTSSAGREMETCDMSVTSSPGSNGGSRGTPPPPPSGDRKRKGRDTDDTECHSEDAEFEYHDAKKQSHGGSTSTKRSRAAEVHNLSERKRRDKINEKMKALQELIPRCNKSDKASMLDEAIEYLKSLQMQVQMMSMGCNMVPMMFPGVQQYVTPVAMGMRMGMGMGMGMDMGMNRTIVPYPAILPGPSLPNHPAAGQAANMSAPMMGSLPQHNQNQERVPNFVDPFQQYIGLHQAQLRLPQNQGGIPPIATKLSDSKYATNADHHQTG